MDPRRDGFTARESAQLVDKVAEELRASPGVEDATFAREAPLKLGVRREPISVPEADGRAAAAAAAQVRAVGPGHFRTLGATIALGEGFAESPNATAGEPVAQTVVNEAAAEMLFGADNPVGRTIRLREQAMLVVGVVRYGSPAPFSSETPPTVFVPITADELDRGVTLAVRAPRGLDAETIRRAVERADSRLSWFDATTLDQRISELERARHSATALNVAMGGFAFALACVGLAGVTAQAVERRRKEIGIEMALGARWTRVMRGVMKEGAVMTLCGVALGWTAAFGLSRALIAANDQFAAIIPAGASVWWLMFGAPGLLALLALGACWWPARRAAAVDPLEVLRAE
jgi:hypothetical protein